MFPNYADNTCQGSTSSYVCHIRRSATPHGMLLSFYCMACRYSSLNSQQLLPVCTDSSSNTAGAHAHRPAEPHTSQHCGLSAVHLNLVRCPPLPKVCHCAFSWLLLTTRLRDANANQVCH